MLLCAELVARVATSMLWRSGLAAFPEVAQTIEFTKQAAFPTYTKETLFAGPEAYPAPIFPRDNRNQAVRWTTFDALPPEAFRSVPTEEAPRAGVVRIAFFGGSTTWNGYPEEVGRRFAERFGEGRVEILNLGVPSSTSWTSLVLMRRYLPRWRPHVVVVYQGFNDQVNDAARGRALLTEADGSDFVLLPSPQRGLLSLAREAFAPLPRRTAFQNVIEAGHEDRAEDAWWSMARLAWANGSTLVMSTFASPAYATLPPAERAYFEAEFRYVFPWVGGVEVYAARLAKENARVRAFATRAGCPLVDVAAGIHGGRDIFKDNCHLDEAGRVRQSEIVASALDDVVQRLLDDGAPPPAPRPPVPRSAAAERSSDACARGRCPAGACLIEPGRVRLGYAGPVQERWGAALHDTLGLPRMWYADARSVEDWEHGAFCVDRYERSEADRAACVAAGACPPYVEPPDANRPAALPTATEARALCAFYGGRIPDEREWEAGVRGADGRLLPWGDEWTGTEANLCGRECPFGRATDPDDGIVDPASRDRFGGTSSSGLRDAAGNLAEWVEACTAGKCTEWLRGGSALSPPGLLWRRRPDGLGDAAPRLRGVRCAYDASPPP